MASRRAAKYAVIGAGIHGLSTAFHLAQMLKATGRGSGEDILVVDKTSIAAGASGIACGVVRNNYFQPAMRELMAHSVEVWESDPKAYSYHPVGYMQISPEVHARAGRHDLRAAEGDRLSVRVHRGRRRLDEIHEAACSTTGRRKGITSVLHEKKGGYANNTASMLRPRRQGRGRRRAHHDGRRGAWASSSARTATR